jgi:hypothetical protein
MPPENETTDLRSTIEDAYDASESEAGRPTEDAAQPVRTEAEAPATDKAPREDRGDGRRVDGKFARKTAPVDDGGKPVDPGAAVPAVVAGDAPKPVEAKPDPFAKAPQSWKPGAREAWASVPPDVRAEVYRREKESAMLAQQTSQARHVTDYVSQLQQKYAPALQAEGVDALTASANLMNLASELRFGPAQIKAQRVAQIIRNYGVDVNLLANVLDGQPVPQGQQPQMMTDPRVDQLLAQLQGMQQSRQEAVVEKAVGEVEAFGGDKEFFEDVREDMADLLEVASRRGIDLSLDQAYERACQMQPEISKVLAARAAAQQAGTARQSTQRARAAASSVRGTPSNVSTNSQPDNLRGAIEAAIETVGGR